MGNRFLLEELLTMHTVCFQTIILKFCKAILYVRKAAFRLLKFFINFSNSLVTVILACFSI